MHDTLEMLPGMALDAGWELVAGRARMGLLIATDGRPAADAAIIVGRSLANRDGERYELVAVEQLERAADDRRAATIQQRDMPFRLAQQRSRTTNVAIDSWPLSIAYGRPASTIVELGDHAQRRMIVMGLHIHSMADRLLGRDTVLQVIHRAMCPVLAVDSNRRTIPRRTLLAIDFCPSSVAAARAALCVAGETGPIYLVHVACRTNVPFDARQPASYESDIEERLANLRAELSIPPHVETHLVVLRGDPARELLAFAEQEGIELIATGSRGFSAFRGPLIGAVPTAVVRAARCSVLVAPPLSE
jgi:nucleotide-binding universal stress UspA family protein